MVTALTLAVWWPAPGDINVKKELVCLNNLNILLPHNIVIIMWHALAIMYAEKINVYQDMMIALPNTATSSCHVLATTDASITNVLLTPVQDPLDTATSSPTAVSTTNVWLINVCQLTNLLLLLYKHAVMLILAPLALLAKPIFVFPTESNALQTLVLSIILALTIYARLLRRERSALLLDNAKLDKFV